MRLRGRKKSENMIDLGSGEAAPRSTGKKAAIGGGLGLIVVAVITLLSGGDLSQILGAISQKAQEGGGIGGGTAVEQPGRITANSPAEQKRLDFISQVLKTTEEVWDREFPRQVKRGQAYEHPNLIHFRDHVRSGCGAQSEEVGPFYCGADKNIYIDLTFFQQLATKFSAAGDFAQAYVIAHEVGHHIQQIGGVSDMVRAQKRGKSETMSNRWSVRQELHADFLAGVWGHYVEEMGILERGDLEEALNAAAQIGDDTLQKRARGYTQPDGFTHGTARQRQRWFRMGFDTGDLSAGQALFSLPYGEL